MQRTAVYLRGYEVNYQLTTSDVLFKKTCMCVLYLKTNVLSLSVYVCLSAEGRGQYWCCLSLSTLFFKIRSLTEPGAVSARLAGQQAPERSCFNVLSEAGWLATGGIDQHSSHSRPLTYLELLWNNSSHICWVIWPGQESWDPGLQFLPQNHCSRSDSTYVPVS